MTIAAGVLVLPDQLAQPGQVHEGQTAQVQHDVAHTLGLGLEPVEHLGDLRDRHEVELSAKRDERRPAMGERLDLEMIGPDGLCCGHVDPFGLSPGDCANEGGEAKNPKTRAQCRRSYLGDAAACRVDELVLAALDERAQAVERVPDVGVARVERRDAEPDRVGAAEVGDDVRALDQRDVDLPRLRVGDGDVRAAPRRVAR